MVVSFYVGASLLVIFAVLTVTTGKLLRSAIYLLFVLVGIAVFYISMNFMFLAAVQVVVYMGGILVLIIFSILLTSHINEKLQKVSLGATLLSILGAVAGAGVICSVILNQSYNVSISTSELTVKEIGEAMLGVNKYGYVLPFEVISILLLAAMIAAIAIAKRDKETTDD